MEWTLLKSLFDRRGAKLASYVLAFLSVIIVVSLYFRQNPFLEAFESRSYDLRFSSLRGAVPPHPDIGIIAIDDKSVKELGRFPWSRQYYARLLDRLTAADVKAVLFDVTFSEQESVAADRALAQALKRNGRAGLAVAFEFDRQFNIISSTHSLKDMERNVTGLGHINWTPEEDGVGRRNKLYVDADGKKTPSLGMLGAMMALDTREFEAGQFDVKLAGRQIPVDVDHFMWINYTGPSRHYPYYSFVDIVQGRVDPALLKGKILFVGATALGIYDLRVTPFDRNTPGVEVHATVADNILSGQFIRRTGVEAMIDIVLIVALGGLMFFLTRHLGFYLAFPLAIALSALYMWFAYWMFSLGHWLSMIYPLLAIMVSLLICGSFRYLVLERGARELRSIFSSYQSEKLVARLEADPEAANIGGDNKDVTIIFTDIKGFTSFSEKRSPREVVQRLNEYLAVMVQDIEEYDGFVDKFIGDGIMAYWGAPLPQVDHASLAIACVLKMQKSMKMLQAKWQAEGLEPFSIRAGVQSGEVVAGNVGLHGRKMEYTVIGDTVNQSSRLESNAKFYGVDTLVGEETYLRTRDNFRYRELDKIRMVGKQVPVTVYELLGERNESFDEPFLQRFADALEVYRSREWGKGEQLFAKLHEDYPLDRPVEMYLDRCRFFLKTPANMDWDGVFNRRGK